MWSVFFWIIEGVFYIVAALCLLSLSSLSQDYVSLGVPPNPYFKTMGLSLLATRDWANFVLGVLCFCLGALMYYIIFLRSKLVPGWLTIWGFLGIGLLFSMALMILFGAEPSGMTLVLALPIALQELVLAVWLIVKGFNASAIDSEPARMAE